MHSEIRANLRYGPDKRGSTVMSMATHSKQQREGGSYATLSRSTGQVIVIWCSATVSLIEEQLVNLSWISFWLPLVVCNEDWLLCVCSHCCHVYQLLRMPFKCCVRMLANQLKFRGVCAIKLLIFASPPPPPPLCAIHHVI